jgi:hypothetical protein
MTINHWINGRAVDREPERAGPVPRDSAVELGFPVSR